MNFEETASASTPPEVNDAPTWRPLSSIQRRIVGVLIEKSKTTKDAYPLTLNSLTNGCNQKSNRSPKMDLAADDVMIELDQLREMNAVVEIHSDGRVAKYKHTMYQWLGVDKVEMAVIGELLLRGEQTIGELRGRAARMEPIESVSGLQPILQSLKSRNLVVDLTPPGRGQMVTHGLYLENELTALRKQVGQGTPASSSQNSPVGSQLRPVSGSLEKSSHDQFEKLERQIEKLTEAMVRIENRLDQLES
jgi:uncharacterized protein YceH (UPF0502 family)